MDYSNLHVQSAGIIHILLADLLQTFWIRFSSFHVILCAFVDDDCDVADADKRIVRSFIHSIAHWRSRLDFRS